MPEDQDFTNPPSDDNEIIALRRAKLAELRKKGNAFPNDFRRTVLAENLHTAHKQQTKEELATAAIAASVSGRIMLRRGMGKASFVTLQDMSGRIQAYIRLSDVGDEAYAEFNKWDIGDIVAISGTVMRAGRRAAFSSAFIIRSFLNSLDRMRNECARGVPNSSV